MLPLLVSTNGLADLEASGQVVIRYAEDNSNGSAAAIAGVCNAEGTVVGLMPHPEHAVDPLTGSKVILFGSTTGPDGVGGASVLASATFGGGAAGGHAAKRPSVQVGDPFLEKLLVFVQEDRFDEVVKEYQLKPPKGSCSMAPARH